MIKKSSCLHFRVTQGFPGGASGKEPTCQCRRCKRCGFDPWVRKMPWRRTWQPTPVFLPGKSHGQRSLVGYSPVQFSRSAVSDSLWPHERQHARPPCPSPTSGVYPNPCPLSRWCHPSYPLSSPSPPALNLSQHQGLFKGVSSSHQVDKVLEFQLQHQSFQWTPRTDLL